MKPQKSPENEEVTPSKKKLKQARLPFKLLTETSPKSDVAQTRKRKLSVPETQPVTKLGKITKENETNELVVISDDDHDSSKNHVLDRNEANNKLNPFVKLVDTAWKKKLQKSKVSKKKKVGPKRKAKIENGSSDTSESKGSTSNGNGDTEMDVDDLQLTNPEEYNKELSKESSQADLSQQSLNNEKLNEIITLEDSNDIMNYNCTVVENEDKLNLPHDYVEEECESKNLNETLKTTIGSTPESPITPRRTSRNKPEQTDKSLNTSQISSEESGSSQNTPRRSTRSSSMVRNEGDVSTKDSNNTNLTPKQLQKKLENAQRREEREKKKQQEKEEREKMKQEKEAQKRKEKEEKEEAKRREKEEKDEQRKKEKEEKEKQKEIEKKLREEKEEQKRREKEEKEEQRRKEKEAREDEKRKRQEALELEKQEQEQKKKKAAEAFVSFFVPKQKTEKDQTTVGLSKNDMLSNFTIKTDMRLAPTVRIPLTEERKATLDKFLETQNVEELYVQNIKKGNIKPSSSGKTWPLNDKDDDIMIIEDELPPIDGAGEIISCEPGVREKLRPKLLSFHENRRPPYWGTWRKKSSFINPRKPFKMDEKQLDYEVDSDEEWEEEEGESIDGSAAGSDDELGPDEYEVDNELFVPHGYLSDEEATMDDDDVLSLSPETQKARLKHLEDEFESELKKPMEKLKPRLYGLIWETSDGGKPDKCVDALWSYFSKVSMIVNDPTPLMQPSIEPEGMEKKKVKKKKAPTDTELKSPAADKKKKSRLEIKENKQKNEKHEKNQLGINAFLTKVKSS